MKNGDIKIGIRVAALIAIMGLGAEAWARTDVKAAVEQLKTNESNAKGNQKQYEDNAEIASKNIVEVTSAIKQLREQKSQLNANANNLERNRAILDKMKEKLETFKSGEVEALKREGAQIAQLRSALEKLEANKVIREQNVETYTQKIVEVEQEKKDWNDQKETFASISKELDGKEKKALAEREKWIEKRKGYKTEAGKWAKEAQVAEQQRVKFDHLRD